MSFGWCALNNVEIITVPNRTHADARNWLMTAGGGFENPKKLIDSCYQIVFIDSDQVFSLEQLKVLIEHRGDFITGWYVNGDTPMVARWLLMSNFLLLFIQLYYFLIY